MNRIETVGVGWHGGEGGEVANNGFMGMGASFWVKMLFWSQIVVVTALRCMC